MLKKKRKEYKKNNLVLIFKNGSSFNVKNIRKINKYLIRYYSFYILLK